MSSYDIIAKRFKAAKLATGCRLAALWGSALPGGASVTQPSIMNPEFFNKEFNFISI